jgi:hypothetical protein
MISLRPPLFREQIVSLSQSCMSLVELTDCGVEATPYDGEKAGSFTYHSELYGSALFFLSNS